MIVPVFHSLFIGMVNKYITNTDSSNKQQPRLRCAPMRFRPGKVLDPTQIEDRRGAGGFGGPIAVGGGGLGIVGIVIYLLFALLGGGNGGAFNGLDGVTVASPGQSPGSTLDTDC